MRLKSVVKGKSDFNYDSNHAFNRFYKEYDELEEMSLDSKYNRIKEFNKLLISFKSVKTKKTETRLKKKRIMKNVNELYKKNYNESNQAKKKKFDHNQFTLANKTDKGLKLDE